ncbi:MAG: hypothetical protein QM756_44610 [Polyangiaceae bacterium]
MSRLLRGGAAVLLLALACGRSATADWEGNRSTCGMDALPPPPPALQCPTPTQERDGYCSLPPHELKGECVPGYHDEPGDAEHACIADQARPDAAPSPSKQEVAWAAHVVREIDAYCGPDATDPLAGVEALHRALKLRDHPSVWAALARCQEVMKKDQHALHAWRGVLLSARSLSERELESPRWALLRERASERVASLEKRMTRLALKLPTDVPELRVALDRSVYALGSWADGLEVEAGEHELIVTAPGHQPWIYQFRLAPKETTLLEPALERQHEPGAGGAPGV